MQNPQEVQSAVAALHVALEAGGADLSRPPVALVLGTGLSAVGEALLAQPGSVRVPFADIPAMPRPGVDSHAGAFVWGRINGVPVLGQLGRCHLYEGRTAAEVCMGVRVMAGMGARALVITNAAGALDPLFAAGSLMCIADMINHTGVSPLTGPNCDSFGERFPDMCEPYDREFRKLAQAAALRLGIRLEEGVYIGVHGPEMETPAETRMYRQWGADAVGMSTVLEVIAARHMGLRVLGISCLTNKNLPDCMAPAPLAEVIAVAGRTGEALGRLLTEVLPEIAAA